MPIKSQEISKYYIEQIILTDDNNPDLWDEQYYKETICNNDKCIGYLFNLKEASNLVSKVKVLNLYLIKPEYYLESSIENDELREKLKLFEANCAESDKYTHKMNVFRNPPLKNWMDTKENWCKKLAHKMSQQFNLTFDDALSEVYYTVVKCYSKSFVYMGNLGYIQTAAYNNIRMRYRTESKTLNQDYNVCDSLDQTISSQNEDNEKFRLIDAIPAEKDNELIEFEYNELEADCKKLLSDTFSLRDIDQIIKNGAGYLPMNIYRKLLKWRKQHSRVELFSGGIK